MSNVTIYDSDGTYPMCESLLCPVYWKTTSIIGWINICGRMGVAILIFLLGTKMQKDFIRSVTLSIFVPVFLSELFNVYCEAIAFSSLFCNSTEEYMAFEKTYISWTGQFVYFVFDYNHYNCLFMMVFLLHCCRLATYPGDHINLFPINTICWVLQIPPFFLSVMLLVERELILMKSSILVISCLARIVTLLGVVVLVARMLLAIPIVFRELPYGHAAAPDIQLQDARSRLAWCLIYTIVPLITLLPFCAESIAWLAVMGKTDQPNVLQQVQVATEPMQFLINYYRPTGLVFITMACLPCYRRAVPLLFLQFSFCPQVKVQAVPRRAKETSTMYRYAD